MWPVCWFPGQVQQPSDSRYLLFLWQLGKRCACRPVHHTWRFWPLPGSPLHLPLWQCRQCVILHKCLGQWHPRPLAWLWTMGSVCCCLGISHFYYYYYYLRQPQDLIYVCFTCWCDTDLNEACVLLVNLLQLLICFQPDIDIRIRTHTDQVWNTLLIHTIHSL